MRRADQRQPRSRPASRARVLLSVGDRVSIVGAPTSYGYNGCVGTVLAIDGEQISVQVDDPPGDMACTTFYQEELVRHAPADKERSQP